MAVTIAIAPKHPQFPALTLGNIEGVLVKVTHTGTYATGGTALTPAQLGLSEIFGVFGAAEFNSASSLSGVVPQYDYTNQKLGLYGEDGTGGSAGLPLAELANGATVTGLIVTLLVLGAR